MSELAVIARIRTDFPEKFGIPRQAGLAPDLESRIIFEPEYREPAALKGIEEYSHLWLLWDFSLSHTDHFVPQVTPPRLGGKEKKGVFATRSPFRPNSIGLSAVRLIRVEWETESGPVLVVGGADLLDGTPIYDIKPYLPYADSHPEASGSFGESHKDDRLKVDFPEELLAKVPEDKRKGLLEVLSQDPRAAYNKKPGQITGMAFSDLDVRFFVLDDVLSVTDVRKRDEDFRKVK